MFTDSHTHLYLPEFEDDLESVIANAMESKVNRFLLPNIDQTTLPGLIATCHKYKDICFPMIGLHPCSVEVNYIEQLEKLYTHIDNEPFIAIGEIGIDLYWEKKFISQQKEAFIRQIELAQTYSLPIVIHCRNAFNEIYDIIKRKEFENITGIFHCFTGDYTQAKKIIDQGFLLGIGGIVTFKNSNLGDVVRKIDLKHIVLETDAPYLAPAPMRGKRNESKYISIIAEKISEIKNTTITKISESTNHNINTLFFNKKI